MSTIELLFFVGCPSHDRPLFTAAALGADSTA